MTIWQKIKAFFGVLDYNKDGVVSSQDAKDAVADAKNKVTDTVDEIKTETKRRVKRVKMSLTKLAM